MITLTRKAFTVTATAVTLVAGLAGTASATDGMTFFNRGTQSCMRVTANSTVGSPVLVGTCGVTESLWQPVGIDGALRNAANGLCLEVPSGGGYAFLQTCGGRMQAMDIDTPGNVFVTNDPDSRLLEADTATGRVRSAEITGEQNQSWAFH
ncbi:hypothetical protein [Actinocrispum wychmicini]|uniref:Ricin-type beta-trefoil lectin protein n=1 Tax=Actinocrispum wychmicini TaxID=1213861 RepID=A0A4R2JCE5_9PSEU|nr:hypothetical protein [Actinocrispum wychmicini]TCO57231.1 hypothetical protein EV192_106708 [Actinocrispum wychmicini]